MLEATRPILITGCARSGTSLTAGVIHHCGAFGGDMTGATPHNKKGQFENGTIRDRVTKPFLAALGVDKLGQHPLPDTNSLKPVDGFNSTILSIMRSQGYRRGPWFYKGAKLCLVWPIWAAAFPDARWIIVRRDADEIAASCMRTSFMRAFDDHSGWLGWVREHEERFTAMRDAGLDVCEIWPSEGLKDLSIFENMIKLMGLEWNEKAVKEFVTPSLWNAV